MEDFKKDINKDKKKKKYDPTKNYREILTLSNDAKENEIVYMCTCALKYRKEPEIVEAAEILIDPETREAYDKDRDKMFKRQQAEEERRNKEADAEIIAEKQKKKAERKAKEKLEKGIKKAERNLEKTKKRIAKDTEIGIKIAEEEIDNSTEYREKVVHTNTDELTANNAKKIIKYIFKKHGIKLAIGIIVVSVLSLGALNYNSIKENINALLDKDNDKEMNYDDALTVVAAGLDEDQILEEQEFVIQANNKARSVEQEVEETQTMTFTDPYNDEQVDARAKALNNYFKANNYYGITEEELSNQTKYINESYSAKTDNESYGMQDAILNTLIDFSNTITLNDTYISGVSENGTSVGIGLDAFLVDNSLNKEIVTEGTRAFQNLLTAKTSQEQVGGANELLILEYELMKGLKQKSDGSNIDFGSLSPSEGFFLGLIFKLGNTKCPSILEENGKIPDIPYINSNGEQELISYDALQAYYDPQYNGKYNPDNAWAIYCTDLITNAEVKRSNYN